MYELKTLLPVFEIDVPKCMYAMKSLTLKRESAMTSLTIEGTLEVSGSSDWRPNDPVLVEIRQRIDNIMQSHTKSAMTRLEDEQNKVIKKLQELRNLLNSMRSQLNNADPQLGKTSKDPKEKPLPDIVINAHPKYIPYALLALKNIWKNVFNIQVKCYKHSSIGSEEIREDVKEFEKQISIENSNSELPGIKVTFIWKNTEHTEMITSQTMFVPIYGEVNIIRYLARVGPAAYRYDEIAYSNDIDIILDICYQLLRCTTDKARLLLLRSLNNRLRGQSYFAGDQMSIADIAVCSSIKRTPGAAKDLTENMNNWLGRVNKIALI